MSKRHQINILTSQPGKTWASCSTCGRSSKQGTPKEAEVWMASHQDEVMRSPSFRIGAKRTKRLAEFRARTKGNRA